MENVNANVQSQEDKMKEMEMQMKLMEKQMEFMSRQQPINVNVAQSQSQAQAQGFPGFQVTGNIKDGTITFLLCLFLGCFGAHKFYEGKAGVGMLYLLTFGLFGFGWFVDCIALLGKLGKKYYVL